MTDFGTWRCFLIILAMVGSPFLLIFALVAWELLTARYKARVENATPETSIKTAHKTVNILMNIFDISPETATTLYNWSYWGLILSSSVALVSTGIAFWTNGIKEAASTREISELRLKTEELRQKNIEGEKRLVQMQIDNGPRSVKLVRAELTGTGTEGLSSVLKAHPPGEAIIWFISNDPEAEGFARQLWIALKTSGWEMRVREQPIPADVPARENDAMARARSENRTFGFVPINGSTPLLVVTTDGFAANFDAPPTTPAQTITAGLLKCGFMVSFGPSPIAPAGVVLLVVGQKQ